MYRHELHFVLRFGVRGRFEELARTLREHETSRGWAPPRFWHTTTGRVNELVIAHEYETVEAFRSERSAFHEEPGEVGATLAALAELAVPGTAVELELDGIDAVAANG